MAWKSRNTNFDMKLRLKWDSCQYHCLLASESSSDPNGACIRGPKVLILSILFSNLYNPSAQIIEFCSVAAKNNGRLETRLIRTIDKLHYYIASLSVESDTVIRKPVLFFYLFFFLRNKTQTKIYWYCCKNNQLSPHKTCFDPYSQGRIQGSSLGFFYPLFLRKDTWAPPLLLPSLTLAY